MLHLDHRLDAENIFSDEISATDILIAYLSTCSDYTDDIQEMVQDIVKREEKFNDQ